MNCENDTFWPTFKWSSSSNTATDYGSLTHIIDDDSSYTIPFVTVGNSIAGCIPSYSLFKTNASGVYIAYTDTNVSVDNIALDTVANPTQILITTSAADDAALDGQTWELRVSVASMSPLSSANNP